MAVRRHKGEPWIRLPSLAGAFLVLVASLLGAVVVWTELAWWVRLVHLGIAEGVVACMIVVTLVTWRAEGGAADDAGRSDGWTDALILASLAGTFLVILWGSYMVGYGAGVVVRDVAAVPGQPAAGRRGICDPHGPPLPVGGGGRRPCRGLR